MKFSKYYIFNKSIWENLPVFEGPSENFCLFSRSLPAARRRPASGRGPAALRMSRPLGEPSRPGVGPPGAGNFPLFPAFPLAIPAIV